MAQGLARTMLMGFNLSVAKKAMQGGPSKRSTSAGSVGSSKVVMNIKQKVVLSNEQQQVMQSVVGEGKNIFFTGSAGELTRVVAQSSYTPQVPVNQSY